jgi:hypothetical protein
MNLNNPGPAGIPVPFQLVSPNLGGLPRSNFPVEETPFDCHAELERGLPAGDNQGM